MEYDNSIFLDETKNGIWNPIKHLMHVNAVIGTVLWDQNYFIGVRCLTEEILADIGSTSNDILISGSDNELIVKQKFKVSYPCQMNMKFFPFDDQECEVLLGLESKGNKSVYLKADESSNVVAYGGSLVLQEFEIMDIT